MTGLWFEYVWNQGYTDGLDYKCGMWTVLHDEGDNYVAFNHLQKSENEKDNDLEDEDEDDDDSHFA